MEPATGALLVVIVIIVIIVLIVIAPKRDAPTFTATANAGADLIESRDSDASKEDPFAAVACRSCREILRRQFSPSSYSTELSLWKARARTTHAFGRFESTYAGMRRQYPNAAELFIYQEMIYDLERRNGGVPRVERIPCDECFPRRT